MLLKWLTWHSVYALEDDLDISLNSHTSVWVKLEVWTQSDVLIQAVICGTLFCFFFQISVAWKLLKTWRSQSFLLGKVPHLILEPSASRWAAKAIKTQVLWCVFPLLTFGSLINFMRHLFGGRSSPVSGFFSLHIWECCSLVLVLRGPTFTEIHFQRQHFWTPLLLGIKLAFFLSTVQRLVFVP